MDLGSTGGASAKPVHLYGAQLVCEQPSPEESRSARICLGSRCGVKAALPPARPCVASADTVRRRSEKPPGEKRRACLTHVSLPLTRPYMLDMHLRSRDVIDPESWAPALARDTYRTVHERPTAYD